jgi:hypothetical protein
MNRQKREAALRHRDKSGEQSDQPGRSSPPERDRMHNREDMDSPERHQTPREPGKLPLPE